MIDNKSFWKSTKNELLFFFYYVTIYLLLLHQFPKGFKRFVQSWNDSINGVVGWFILINA